MKNKRIMTNIILLIIGIISLYIGGYIGNVIKSLEFKMISVIFISIGACLFGISISKITILKIEQKNPNYKHKQYIEENDERNMSIRNRAKGKAFDFMITIYGILMLVYALTKVAFNVILLLCGCYLFVFIIYLIHFIKYSKEM